MPKSLKEYLVSQVGGWTALLNPIWDFLLAMNYAEKLKDPRWQKKRLEILERDDWTCQCCGDSKSTLHVHHINYFKGKEPWDYDINNFITYCESCHSDWHTLALLGRLEFLYISFTSITDEINILEYLGKPDNDNSIYLIKRLDEIIKDWDNTKAERRVFITEQFISLRQFI